MGAMLWGELKGESGSQYDPDTRYKWMEFKHFPFKEVLVTNS